jgi:WD40 repeat protein
MTGRPTFDQLLADWIEDGPTDAPDRVLETVIAAIPSIPQRRSAMRFSRGFSAMPLPSRLAAVAVIGVVVVGAALFLTRPSPPAVGGPSPAPGVIANPSAPGSPSAGPSSSVVGPRPASWTATGSMVIARAGHNAVLLPDGRVLVVGGLSKLCYCDQGPLASAELYDPTTGSWAATGSMVTHRGSVGTLTLLLDGRVLAAGDGTSELYDPATGTWTASGKMVIGDASYNATLLPDGRVLVAGGGGGGSVTCDGCAPRSSAELYDPASGTWTPAADMTRPRSGPTATLLPDGRVLVVGGDPPTDQPGPYGPSTAELYDPGTGTWTATGSMGTPRGSHTATLLPDGMVLVAGGGGDNAGLSAELYSPALGTWAATGKMIADPLGGTATLLPDGKVLVVGSGTAAELYDPGSESWTATASMTTPRESYTATLLQDGRVLVAGGASGFVANVTNYSSATASAELYEPGSLAPSSSLVAPRAPSWTASGSMSTPRDGHTATLLPNGRVLVTGGYNGGHPLASAELYDPTTGSWAATGSMVTHRGGHTATLLPDGKVLVAGCANGNDAPSAELYDPGTGSWTATGSMVTPRCLDFTATLLPDGRVLVAGGMGTGTVLASAELYDPGTGSWTATGSMATPRYDHTATLLPNGKVLVAGGVDHGGAGCCALTSAELYDPASGSWTATGSMGAPHSHHTATLLPDGTVLVVDVSAELYDPATGSWTATKNPTTTFAVRATLLADGRVLGVGLVTVGTAQGSSVEVYDPASGSWTAAGGKGTPPYRNGFTATLLADGRVLVAGGFSDPQCGDCSTLASALLYDPGSP